MLSLAEQLGNVGSEYSRITRNEKSGNEQRALSARKRYFELLDLTINDPRWSVHRKRELLRLREITGEQVPEDLQKYFDQFVGLVR